MVKNVIIIVLLVLSFVFGISVISEHSKFLKAKELIECYDRIVDTIHDDYFLDVICTTDEWRDLQNCVERNHIGCGCSKDIMPYE